MAMPEERMLAFGQHNAHQKVKCGLGAGGCGLLGGNYRGDKGLARYKDQDKSTACDHFSIRGFVARSRELNTRTCWPFPQHLLETRLRDGYDPVLPPIDIPEYRWWNCQKCISILNTTAKSSVENEDINNLLEPSQEYKGEFISYKEDEQTVTNGVTDQITIESLVPAGSEMKNLENLDSGVQKCEALPHSSNFPDSKGNINVTNSLHHVQEEITNVEIGHPTVQKMVSKLQRNTDNELDSIANKAEIVSKSQKDTDGKIVSMENKIEALNDFCQPINSWECFSRKKNIFEEISDMIREKEMQKDTLRIPPLDSNTSKADNSGLHVNRKEDVSHAHIRDGEKICLGQHIFPENQTDKETIPGTLLEPVAVQKLELNIEKRDHVHLVLEEQKDVTSVRTDGNESFYHAQINPNFTNQRKDHTNHCTKCAPLEQVNALPLEKNEKLKDNESKHKRKSRKKRSIADIIASEAFHPETLSKETEQCIHADIMEKNIHRTESHVQFPLQIDKVKHQKDAEKRLRKSRVGRNGLPKIDISNIDMHNVVHEKGRPEKLKVRKKRQVPGAQCWNSKLMHFAKDSLDLCKSDAIRYNNQVPQGASNMWRNSSDKSLQKGFFHLANGKSKQRVMGLDDEIPMEIVELLAKNQHERGLSKPVPIYESHNIQTGTISNLMSGRNSDLEITGPVFDSLNPSLKEKDISEQPTRIDPACCPAFLEEQNTSGVMHQGNVQTPGNEHIFSASEMRLTAQSSSVPNGFGNFKNSAIENQDYRNCLKPYAGSSEKHASRVHPIPCASSEEVEGNGMERRSEADTVVEGPKPTRESMHITNQAMNPPQTVPPVPKFRASEYSILNGDSQIQGTSCTFPGNTNDALQSSSMDAAKPRLSSTLMLENKQDGLQCSNVINASNKEIENPSTLPIIAESTDSVKGLNTPSKRLRSCGRLPSSRKHHRSALHIYLEKRCQRLQSSSASKTADANQSSAKEEAWKTERDPPGLVSHRENQVSSSYCNIEICTLNQNPAELNFEDGEENIGIFGYEDSSDRHIWLCGLLSKSP